MNFKSLKPPYFESVLIETGLSAAIARGEPLSERMEATIFWVSAASGIAFVAGADLIALLFSRFVPGHDVLPSLLALSPVLLASALLTLPNGLVIRQQKFWAFAIADICAVIMSSTAAIILAFHGYGVWALVIQIQILTNTKLVVLYLCARPNISFKFHVSEIGWMLKFGFHAALSNISTLISRTIDNMLIGGLLGTLKLGWYAMAF